MHSHILRILLPLIALLLVGLVSLIAPIEAQSSFQTIIVLGIVVAAAMIVRYLPITRHQLMKAYVLIGSGMICVFIFSVILSFFFGMADNAYINEIGVGCLTGGIILAFIGGAKLRRTPENDIQDERTKKIGAWGITYSWYLTFLFIIFLWLADSFGINVPDGGTLLCLLILIMPISAYIFQSYFFRRGDIDP